MKKIIIKKDMLPIESFSTMGCRTQNGADINAIQAFKDNIDQVIATGEMNNNFISAAQKDGRGNIAPSTIILPTLAMEAKEKSGETGENILKCFMDILDEAIDDCITGLRERFNWIANQSPKAAAFMYDNNTMAGYIPEEGIRSALKHGTLAVGQLGLAEALQILIGCDHTEPEGLEIAKEIEQLFKDKCAKAKETEKLNYGVYFTPAETLCHTAMKKFQKKYGKIKDVSDKDFFTNSMHVPVWKNMDPFSKIEIESQLTGYSSAGCITYIEIDANAQHNIPALETIVNYAMDNDIPYFAINCPSDTCTDCGFTSLIVEDKCPKCGGHNIERLRRVTGYITGNYTTAFNPGKQQEVEMRVQHLKGKLV